MRDRSVIDRAAADRMDELDQYALSSDPQVRDQVQRLMNEVARARTRLVEALPTDADPPRATTPVEKPLRPTNRPRLEWEPKPSPPAITRGRHDPPAAQPRPLSPATRLARSPWAVPLLATALVLTLSTIVIYVVLLRDNTGATSSAAGGPVSAGNNATDLTADANASDAEMPTPSTGQEPSAGPKVFERSPELQAYIELRDSLEPEAQAELIRQTLSEYNGGVTVSLQYEVNPEGEIGYISLGNSRASAPPGSDPYITDLSPLAGLKLWRLTLRGLSSLESIEPLRGMPLQWIAFMRCTSLRDLEPLEGMALTRAKLENVPATDFSVFRWMPIRQLVLRECPGLDSLEPFRGMPLTSVWLDACAQVTDVSPLSESPIRILSLRGTGVSDLEPLRGMPLTVLHVQDCGGVTDLSPLTGKELNTISLSRTGVSGLMSLQGMQFRSITLDECPNLRSLDGLEGQTLDYLNCSGCTQLEDISALTQMKVNNSVTLSNTNISSLPALAGLSFGSLYLTGCTRLTSLDGLQGVTLELLNCEGCENLEDISALAEATISRSINLSRTAVRDISPLRDSACIRLWLDDCEHLESLEWVWDMPNVTSVYFRNIGITREEVEQGLYSKPNRRYRNIRLVDQ